LLFNIETKKDVGNYIISSVINKKDPNYLKKINSKINKITKKHIYQFVDKIFKKCNLFIVINGTDVINYDNIKQIIDDI
jgi:predicted Zn-dependent peptidase